jgi:hypothetical protein
MHVVVLSEVEQLTPVTLGSLFPKMEFNYSRTLLRSLSGDERIREFLSGKTY